MRVSVVTPDTSFFDGEATFVALPGIDGEFGVLPRHAPLIGRLGHGVARVEPVGGEPQRIAVYGGFVKVQDDVVTVLAGGAARAAPGASAADARRALEQARERLAAVRGRGKDGLSELPEAEEAVLRARAYLALVD